MEKNTFIKYTRQLGQYSQKIYEPIQFYKTFIVTTSFHEELDQKYNKGHFI